MEPLNLKTWPWLGTPKQCADCGESFGSVTAFKRHRVPVVRGDRSRMRCLTAEELAQHAGFHLAFGGLWRTGAGEPEED